MATRDLTYFVTLIVLSIVLMWWSLNMTTDSGDYEDVEEDFDDADDLLLRKMPSPLPSPSPSPITGPQMLRPIVGECFQFSGRDGNGDENRYEFCGFKSVRQTVVKNGNSYSCGYWAKWNTEKMADGKTKWLSQYYNDGESCGGSVRRTTTVKFLCKPESDVPELLGAKEPEMCQYEITLALKEWCNVPEAERLDSQP